MSYKPLSNAEFIKLADDQDDAKAKALEFAKELPKAELEGDTTTLTLKLKDRFRLGFEELVWVLGEVSPDFSQQYEENYRVVRGCFEWEGATEPTELVVAPPGKTIDVTREFDEPSKVKNSIHNASGLIGRIPDLSIWHDEFRQRLFIKWGSSIRKELTDVDFYDITVYLHSLGFKSIRDDSVFKACLHLGHRAKRDELREYLNGLQWDGIHRIRSFLARGLGAADNPYTQLVSNNLLIALAARGLSPGVKFDNMPILEGPQGSLKSSACRALGGPYYSEINESPASKEFAMSLQGAWLVEAAELSALSRAEASAIKRAISCEVDRYRTPFAKMYQNFPRRCVLIGTTNDAEYLKDSTGARRFWPVRVGKIDLGYIKELRDQLFAEAVAQFHAGAAWWEMPSGLANTEQDARYQADAWEAEIEDWLAERETKLEKYELITSKAVLNALGVNIARRDKASEMRVGSILRRLGYEKYLASVGPRRIKAWRSLK